MKRKRTAEVLWTRNGGGRYQREYNCLDREISVRTLMFSVISSFLLSVVAYGGDAAERGQAPPNAARGRVINDGILVIKLEDPDGKAVSEVNIHAQMLETQKAKGRHSPEPTEPVDTCLKNEGLLFLPGGKWSLTIEPSPERPWQGEDEVAVEAGKSVSIVVQVGPAKFVPVRVVVENGKNEGLKKVQVCATVPRFPRYQPHAQTTWDGSTRLNLPVGYEAVITTCERGHFPLRPTSAHIDVRGQPDQTLKLVMENRKLVAWCTARLDDDGDVYDFTEHLPSLRVFGPSCIGFVLEGAEPKIPMNAFFANGRFEFDDIAPGRYAVTDLKFGRVDQEESSS